MTRRARSAVFWTILTASGLILVECACYSFARMRPDLFDQRAAALAKLQPEPFERFKALQAVGERGWDNPAAQTVTQTICTGATLPYTYGPARNRIHGNTTGAVVLMAGDSWTHGDDVPDADTYPAALERRLGVATANLGVGGYDPLQALLKLEAEIGRFSKARAAVLSILDDDVYRILNSYRPVLNPSTGLIFGLKPYIRDGVVQSLPGNPFGDLATMRAAAAAAFDSDYWRRPKARFPYARAVADLLRSPNFWTPQLIAIGQRFGYRPFEIVYRLPAIRDGLRTIFARFAAFARTHRLVPVVAVIPLDPSDRVSGLVALAAATAAQRDDITFVNVVIPRPDRYLPIVGCHPQAEGYAMIADSVADALRPLLARPAER